MHTFNKSNKGLFFYLLCLVLIFIAMAAFMPMETPLQTNLFTVVFASQLVLALFIVYRVAMQFPYKRVFMPGVNIWVHQIEEYPTLSFFSAKERAFAQHGNVLLCREQIFQAAVKCSNGKIYAVMIPGSHKHLVAYLKLIKKGAVERMGHGFITSHGRFVGRREGWDIAIAAKQIVNDHPVDKVLYAEHLWSVLTDNNPDEQSPDVQTKELLARVSK